jgi:hypothetical protein
MTILPSIPLTDLRKRRRQKTMHSMTATKAITITTKQQKKTRDRNVVTMTPVALTTKKTKHPTPAMR